MVPTSDEGFGFFSVMGSEWRFRMSSEGFAEKSIWVRLQSC